MDKICFDTCREFKQDHSQILIIIPCNELVMFSNMKYLFCDLYEVAKIR